MLEKCLGQAANWTWHAWRISVRSRLQWRTIHQGTQSPVSVIPPWRLDAARIRGHIPIQEKKTPDVGTIQSSSLAS